MTNYPLQHTYSLIALVSLVVAGLFGWDLLHDVEVGSILFFTVSLGILLWSTRTAMTKISLTPNQLNVRAPLARPREIEYRQMLSVTEEGRMSKSIVIAYHPRTANGLLDLDDALTIVLPAVQEQATLFEELVQRAPV